MSVMTARFCLLLLPFLLLLPILCMQLFLQHFSSAIQHADLKSRTVVQLTNPILPTETPLKNKILWFDPQLGY